MAFPAYHLSEGRLLAEFAVLVEIQQTVSTSSFLMGASLLP